MKRVIIAAIALTATTLTYAQAETTPAANQPAAVAATDVDERTPVKLEDLPDPVKKTLAGADYAAWKPVAAYWIKGEKTPYYEIEATKGTEKAVIRLNEKGAKVD